MRLHAIPMKLLQNLYSVIIVLRNRWLGIQFWCTLPDPLYSAHVLLTSGQIIFDATGQVDIQGAQHLSESLTDGMIRLGKEQNVSNFGWRKTGKYSDHFQSERAPSFV